MLLILAVIATLAIPGSPRFEAPQEAAELAPPQQGYAAHYGEGVMERVATRRGLEPAPCMVAGIDPAHTVGTWLRVTTPDGLSEDCLVADVQRERDRPRSHRRNIVVELGWPAAQRICDLKRVGEQPPRACPVEVAPIAKPS